MTAEGIEQAKTKRNEQWKTTGRFWSWSAAKAMHFLPLTVLGLAVFVALAVTAKSRATTSSEMTTWAYVLAFFLALVVSFLCGVMIRNAGGRLSDLVVGADNKVSTSKFQYLLWTVGIAFALTFIAFRTFVDPQGTFICKPDVDPHNCVPNDETWQQYLILMGAPAAAAVIAKATATTKDGASETQSDTGTTPTPGDLATNALGHTDIIDLQYLIFNIVAFVYFAATFVNRGTFVTVPALLLGLTSASAATYTLGKALSSNKPIIKSVSPSVISPGTTLTIRGSNFFATASSMKELQVKVTGIQASSITPSGSQPTSQTITALAPDLLHPTDATVVVVTPGGTESDPYPISIAEAGIVGWSAAAPLPGATGVLHTVGRPASATSDEVLINGIVYPASYDPHDRTLTFTVPAVLEPGARMTVTQLVDGRAAATAEVTLGR